MYHAILVNVDRVLLTAHSRAVTRQPCENTAESYSKSGMLQFVVKLLQDLG